MNRLSKDFAIRGPGELMGVENRGLCCANDFSTGSLPVDMLWLFPVKIQDLEDVAEAES